MSKTVIPVGLLCIVDARGSGELTRSHLLSDSKLVESNMEEGTRRMSLDYDVVGQSGRIGISIYAVGSAVNRTLVGYTLLHLLLPVLMLSCYETE